MSHKESVTAIVLLLTVSTSFWAQEPSSAPQTTLTYCVVGTGQTHIFSDRGQILKVPKPGEPFFGQDAFYQGPKPSYRDNGDGRDARLRLSARSRAKASSETAVPSTT